MYYFRILIWVAVLSLPPHEFACRSCFIIDCRKLKVRHLDDLQWDNFHIEFYENRSNFSKVEMAGYTDTQIHSERKKKNVSLRKERRIMMAITAKVHILTKWWWLPKSGRGFESRWGGIFHPSSRTMALGSTQPLTEMSTSNLPGG
jgi:hypothetical protein